MRLILGGIALLLLSTVTACGSSGSDDSPSASTSTTSNRADDPTCALLTAEERRAFAGTAVDETMDSGDPSVNCKWSAGGSDESMVQVTSMPADQWIKVLPDYIERLKSSPVELSAADTKQIAALEKALAASSALDADEACQLFSQFLALQGVEPDSDTVVSYQNLGAGRNAVTAQTCRDGRFTSALMTRPDLEESEAVADKALEAVAKAHDRAVAATR